MNIRKSLLAGAAFAVATIPTLAQAGEVVGSVGDASQTIALRSAQVRIVELDRVTTTENRPEREIITSPERYPLSYSAFPNINVKHIHYLPLEPGCNGVIRCII